MIDLNFDIRNFIRVERVAPNDTDWPIRSPFNLRFSAQKLNPEQSEAISGAGIYLISRGVEVAYLGKFQPINGNIIALRWARHLQTISARGSKIGFGKGDAEKRLTSLLAAVENPNLRLILQAAYDNDRSLFRDSGNTTTPNRLRFASENWDVFGSAIPDQMQSAFTFRLIRIRPAFDQFVAKREVTAIEKRVLKQFKPCCNNEYKHSDHQGVRLNNTVPNILAAVFQAVESVTGEGAAYCVTLEGQD